MWLDFVNLVTFVKGLFGKVVSLRSGSGSDSYW